MSDAVQMLEEQHAEATALFLKLERLTDPTTLASIFRTLDSRLRDHTILEEEIFYPAFRERASEDGEDQIREAEHEHGEVKSKLEEIEKMTATDYLFKRKVSELRQLVEHHVKEEETTILPQARRMFSEPELDEMALRMVKLMSIHSPVYQVGGNKVETIARDTVRRIGDFLSKVGS
jgi:hemerythrin superfamily protein